MNESIPSTTQHFSPAVRLAAIGVKLSQLDRFGPIRPRSRFGRRPSNRRLPTSSMTPLSACFLESTGW